MRKEVSVAIIFGVIIGLVFAFGLFRINKVIKNNPSKDTIAEKNSEGFPNTSVSSYSLTLLKPINNSVTGSDDLQISGVTSSESYIILSGGLNDSINKTNPNGSFDVLYKINPSINNIETASISMENERSNSKIEIVYSSEISKNDSSDKEEETEDIVEEKLKNAQNTAIFYKGTVTDITDNGIEIKNGGGEIKQISYSKDTSFAKIDKLTSKIAVGDVAIGDYILALGYRNNNGVLDTFRVLVTKPLSPSEIKIFYGVVAIKNKVDMEVTENNSGNITIGIDNSSKTYNGDLSNPEKVRFANISEGDTVIGTFFTEKDENIARRIHIIKKTDQ